MNKGEIVGKPTTSPMLFRNRRNLNDTRELKGLRRLKGLKRLKQIYERKAEASETIGIPMDLRRILELE